MGRSSYYDDMRSLARDVRSDFGFTTAKVGLSDLRRIYAKEEIRIDLWAHKLKGLKGAYFNDENGISVMIAKGLPNDPRAFTMAHELKHHYVDRDLPLAFCDPSNQDVKIEIGAEVFAAELLFPEQLFSELLTSVGVSREALKPEDLVRLKRTTGTSLSYKGMTKTAVRLGFCEQAVFSGVRWGKLEEAVYGLPYHKRYPRK